MKKPSITRNYPPDRAFVDAVTENIEIITGRRGNKITAPTKKILTFSATVTKAEAEALYAYVNNVRDALVSLLTRLDA